VVNESAFAAGTRVGEDGLDLARVCPGNITGTSTERAAAFISKLIINSDYYIDMHTGGNLFEIYPLAGYMLHSLPEILETQRNMALAFGLPVIWGTESEPNGRTLSVARDAGVPAIYVEYGGGGTLNTNIIDAYTHGCLQVMESLGMTSAKTPGDHVSVYWMEEDTVNGGYLQGKLPASCNGIFVPEKKPGDMIEKDALLGYIINPLTGLKTVVRSDSAGLLFFLRLSSRVNQGDALGGILPITKPGKIVINGK
jgi:predicted deacylase